MSGSANKSKGTKFKAESNQPLLNKYSSKKKSNEAGSASSANASVSAKSSNSTRKINNNKGSETPSKKDTSDQIGNIDTPNKKRSPPTPPERKDIKKKKPDMAEPQNNEKDNAQEIESVKKKEEEQEDLPPELEKLRRLLKTDIDEATQSLKNSITSLERSNKILLEKGVEIDNIKKVNNRLQENCNQIHQENQRLKTRLIAVENKLLENNIILQGVPDQAWEQSDVTREKALTAISTIANGDTDQKKMEIVRKIGIKNIRRVGNFSNYRHRPICIEFISKCSADFLYEKRRKLEKGIYVDRDYNIETERDRRKLKLILRKAKEYEDLRSKSKMEGNKLIIRGKTYTVGNLDQLPDRLQGHNVSSSTNQETYGFFGELNPLSNFHACEFDVNGFTYHSSEQYIQAKKAEYFGAVETKKDILNSETASECKDLAKSIDNYDSESWNKIAREKCEPGILEKFTQNPRLGNFLISTGNKKILECSYDKVWGIGVPLKDKDCLKEDKWNGENLLGEILMSIRDKLQPTSNIIVDNRKEEDMNTS